MTYASYDFEASLDRTQLTQADIETCIAAWGRAGDGSEWSGGFLMKLKDGRYAYLTGWCDYTGWGCQDGVELIFYDSMPGPEEMATMPDAPGWDPEPADLNRWLRGDIPGFDS